MEITEIMMVLVIITVLTGVSVIWTDQSLDPGVVIPIQFLPAIIALMIAGWLGGRMWQEVWRHGNED